MLNLMADVKTWGPVITQLLLIMQSFELKRILPTSITEPIDCSILLALEGPAQVYSPTDKVYNPLLSTPYRLNHLIRQFTSNYLVAGAKVARPKCDI